MNLIMSDVEETIMIVDPEATTNGQSVVNVNESVLILVNAAHLLYLSRWRNEKWRCCL
jgi:hypothetical protein